MSVAVPPLELCAPKTPIPACSPNLMPFHISYTGPAPVSTYFRMKKTAKPEYGAASLTSAETSEELVLASSSSTSLPTVASDSQSTLVDSQTQSQDVEESQVTLASTQDVHMNLALPDHASNDIADPNHLVAAFRGRTVRGLIVDLPAGYTGLTLSVPDPSSSTSQRLHAPQKSQTNIRPTRNARRATKREEPDMTELAEALQEDEEMKEYFEPVRTLQVTGSFDSFVLWNADIPVDEGKDEYLRSLTEWTKLATVIHEYDED